MASVLDTLSEACRAAFADMGYVNDKRYATANPLANNWLHSYGAGLDFVTYYDKVLRLEYSFNSLRIIYDLQFKK